MKQIITTCLFVLFLFLLSNVNAQKKSSLKEDTLVDAFDILYHILGKKEDSTHFENLEKGTLSAIPGFSYSQLKGFAFVIESNYSYRKTPISNTSVIVAVQEVTIKGYIIPRLTTSLWFKDNGYNFTSDWRYYKYIGEDYGVGSFTKADVKNDYLFNYIRFHNVFSKRVAPGFLFGLGYKLDAHYNIKSLDPENNTNSKNQNLEQKTFSSGIVFNALYDTRKNENFPVGGEKFLNFSFSNNRKVLGSTYNYQSLITDMRIYHSFNRTNVLAIRSYNWLLFGKQFPYFDQATALGDNKNGVGRTYIEGRFRGKKMLFLETEYRFNISKRELIGGALFSNIESFSEPKTNRFQHVNACFGASLRFKVNKTSKVYFVFSYGIDTNGGHGIYMNLGDVF